MTSGDIKPYDALDPEQVAAMHDHIVAFLLEEAERAGREPDQLSFLEETGYPTEAPEERPIDTPPERKAHAIEASGQLVLEYETRPDAESEPKRPQPARQRRPAAPQPSATPARPRGWKRPKARTARQKAARDSRPDLKPWPYGSRED